MHAAWASDFKWKLLSEKKHPFPYSYEQRTKMCLNMWNTFRYEIYSDEFTYVTPVTYNWKQVSHFHTFLKTDIKQEVVAGTYPQSVTSLSPLFLSQTQTFLPPPVWHQHFGSH